MKILLLFIASIICLASSVLVNAEGYIQYLADRYPEARCLDGSSAALFVFPGTVKTSVIFSQQGGGLCTSPETCYKRSKTDLGTSTVYPKTLPDSYLKGVLSRNCTINPGFCQFSVVYLRYCDGTLYSSNLDNTIDYQGNQLHFKGDVIRKAAISHLAELSNTYKVDEIIYSGDSAGGYSTFIHADIDIPFLIKNVPSLQKAGAIPFSGLFPVVPNVDGQPVVQVLSQDLMKMANTTGSANPACMADKTEAEKYTCSLPPVAYNYSKVPTFVLQSHTDAWQIFCELAGLLIDNNSTEQCMGAPLYANTGCPDAGSFTGKIGVYPFSKCNQTQMNPILDYQLVAMTEMKTLNGFQRPANGVFMISCLSHVASQSWHWWGTRINGVAMNTATWNWWKGLTKERSWMMKTVFEKDEKTQEQSTTNTNNVYVDCIRSEAQNGNLYWECNPSCVNPVSSSLVEQEEGRPSQMENPFFWDGKNVF